MYVVGMCGSALPTEIIFLSTSSETTLFYYESADVEDEPKSFNLTFTYVAVRRNGRPEVKLLGKWAFYDVFMMSKFKLQLQEVSPWSSLKSGRLIDR